MAEVPLLSRYSGQHFNTGVTILADCPENMLASLPELCTQYENLLSKTVPGSDVWRINHSKGKPVEVSAHTEANLSLALEMYKASGGLYNIAIGEAIRLWHFNDPDAEDRLPDPDALRKAAARADCSRIRMENRTVCLPEGMEIDLGGIAKGYISDQLGQHLRKLGVKSALINLGGNVLTVGSKPDGTPWMIGLETPERGSTEAPSCWAALPCRDSAVVTSGSYERGRMIGGRWYPHILDPRTGYPAETDVLSVSVHAPTGFLGDAISTPLFLLGPEKGIELAHSYGVFAAWYFKDRHIISSEQ